MLEWMLLPIDSSRAHDLSSVIAWHGRMMTLAWGIAVPIGVLVARYYKILPKQDWPNELDNRVWWHSHLLLHYLAGLLTFGGTAFVLQGLSALGSSGKHALFGWALIFLALGQFIGGWLRGSKGGPTEPTADGSLHGDHYSMTRRRLIFEMCHKLGGYLALCIACAAIVSGLWHANAPIWMWLSLIFWWVGLLWFAIILQLKGRAVDTYQAIWGPDESHKGNTRKPIGFGITIPKIRKP
jgi:hypothetical protein